MKCPHDDELLVYSDAEGHVGLVCGQCHGTWLPFRYIDAVKHTRHFSAEHFKQELQAHTKFNSTLRCPTGCGSFRTAHVRSIELEWCPVCGGVWFDNGELRKLLNQHPPKGGFGNGNAIVAGETAIELILYALLGLGS